LIRGISGAKLPFLRPPETDTLFDNPPPSAFSAVLSDIKTIVETVAVIVGGIWAYYKFFRGRTFKPRLEPAISGRASEAKGLTNVLISVELKNVGLSKVAISKEGSAMRVFATDPAKTDGVAVWQRAITVGVFEKHGWIEPGETITEQALISVAGIGHKAIKLELRLVGNHIEWNALSIIEPEKNSK
jgi:hypothetical protein